MSLVNKMLADLESRVSNVKEQAAAKPVLDGLHSVKDDASKKKLVRMGVWAVVLVGTVGIGVSRLWPVLVPLAPTLMAKKETVAPKSPAGPSQPAPQPSASTETMQEQDTAAGGAVGAIGHEEPETEAVVAELAPHISEDAEVLSSEGASKLVAGSGHESDSAGDKQPMPVLAAEEPPVAVAVDIAVDSEPEVTPAAGPVPPPSSMPAPVAMAAPSAPKPVVAKPKVPAKEDAPVPMAETKRTEPKTATAASSVGLPKPAEKIKETPEPQLQALAPVAVPEPAEEAPKPLPATERVADFLQMDGAAASPELQVAAAAPVDKAAAEKAADAVLADRAYRNGMDYLQAGRMAEAEERLRVALEHKSDHSDARLVLVGVLMNQQRILEAQVILEDGERAGGFTDALAQALSRIYVDLGQEERALRVLERYKSDGVGNPDFMATLAVLYQRQGRFTESAAAYRVALAKRPGEGRWWLGMGLSLESTQQWHAASLAYAQAVNSSSLPATLMTFAEKRLAEVRVKAK